MIDPEGAPLAAPPPQVIRQLIDNGHDAPTRTALILGDRFLRLAHATMDWRNVDTTHASWSCSVTSPSHGGTRC